MAGHLQLSAVTLVATFEAFPSPKQPSNSHPSTFPPPLTIFQDLSQNDLGAVAWILPFCVYFHYGDIIIIGSFLISSLPPPLPCKFTKASWGLVFLVFSCCFFVFCFYLCICSSWPGVLNSSRMDKQISRLISRKISFIFEIGQNNICSAFSTYFLS